jgi:outer membrane protein assembly factor BamB
MKVLLMRCSYLGVALLLGCSSPATTARAVDREDQPDIRKRKTGVDWPGFLGPNRNGVSTETGIITDWPKEGLKVLWEAQMGKGFAPPVVSKGRLYHFDRFGASARLTCRVAETGESLWKFEYLTDYEDLYGYSPGPRACPIVDEDRVYVLGAEGMLYCLNAYNGKEFWKVDTKADYHFHQNFFGVGSVPVVEGDLLIVAVGGSPKGPRPNDLREARSNGTALIAFNKKTGVEKYRIGDEFASYSSPTVTTIDGRRWGFYFARGGLLAFEPATGKIDFHFSWRARILESVNAANPVIVGDRVLISECYEKGSALLKVKNGAKPEEIWTDAGNDSGDKALKCHWNTPIHVDGYVYGCSGRHENEAQLRCVELATGKVMWSEKGLGRCSLTQIDGRFLCMSERGELLLLKIDPKKFDQTARWLTDLAYPTWAAPVVCNGLMYLRGSDRLICVELIPEKKQ